MYESTDVLSNYSFTQRNIFSLAKVVGPGSVVTNIEVRLPWCVCARQRWLLSRIYPVGYKKESILLMLTYHLFFSFGYLFEGKTIAVCQIL